MSAVLPVKTVEKPWGRVDLPEPFVNPGDEPIGEIWFEPPDALPELLVKYLFTSEKLSVQVHPDDDQAEAAGMGRQGKSECWYVIDAEPGATLGVGFHEAVDAEAMRAAALDGSIEDMLAWHPVRAGDFFEIRANTVHAIGAGVTVLEVQQNSDITYRLFDYGRPRELHLDEGIAVANGIPHDPALRRHLATTETCRLIDGPHFVLDRVYGPTAGHLADAYSGPLLVIPRERDAVVGGESVSPGQCALAASMADVKLAVQGVCLLASPCRHER